MYGPVVPLELPELPPPLDELLPEPLPLAPPELDPLAVPELLPLDPPELELPPLDEPLPAPPELDPELPEPPPLDELSPSPPELSDVPHAQTEAHTAPAATNHPSEPRILTRMREVANCSPRATGEGAARAGSFRKDLRRIARGWDETSRAAIRIGAAFGASPTQSRRHRGCTHIRREAGRRLARGSHCEMLMSGMSRKTAGAVGSFTPKDAGTSPRSPAHAAIAIGAMAALLAQGCAPSGSDQQTPPIDLGMTSGLTMPYYSDQNVTLYQVQTHVRLPVRKPTGADLSGLGAAPKGTAYPRAPYLLASDESVLIHYTLSNLDADTHTIWVLFDPWNEFVRYNPGVTVVNDETTIPNYGYDLEFVVPGKSRLEGDLTSDDTQEMAIKLASVMKLLASPLAMASANNPNGYDATTVANNIFNPQNRSNSNDPLYTPWIPPVIAGMTGFDLGLRANVGPGGKPPNMAIEITMEVQDLNGNRFVAQDGNDPEMGMPGKVLSPPAAR
jgi:hypothetical protein